MKEDEVEDIIRYLSPNSILVLTPVKLIRIYCPFVVKPMVEFQHMEISKEYFVVKVNIDRDLQTVYIINGKAYQSRYFLLVL
ncbi:MAG: hypothetical protein CVT99_02220 [Bacteroidetes bacterium HGW-Bacteroidetes-16]|jgi:hypothetical protein|nr:MAG: hypothetical protein CVT99_02220 [Bacteroidetes bacterium HGW-Bacteroidetes-16]